jgi:hypothetical protein
VVLASRETHLNLNVLGAAIAAISHLSSENIRDISGRLARPLDLALMRIQQVDLLPFNEEYNITPWLWIVWRFGFPGAPWIHGSEH